MIYPIRQLLRIAKYADSPLNRAILRPRGKVFSMLLRGAKSTRSLILLIAVAAVFASARPSLAASPAPSAASCPEAHKQAAAISPTDPQAVIAYLTDVIGWYHHLGVEATLVVEPNETLYVADD